MYSNTIYILNTHQRHGGQQMKIVFANHKGGVGKTTFAIITAETLIERGAPVRLYDLDAQRNFSYFLNLWREGNQIGTAITTATITFGHESYTVIDTAPGLGAEAELAIKIADVLVVPVEANTTAIQGLRDILQIKPKGKIIVVLNKFDKKASFEQAVKQQLFEAVKANKEQGFNISFVLIPRLRQIVSNINTGKTWNYKMTTNTENSVVELLREIIKK